MNIDWLSFTPFSALTGGVLIGLASVALLLTLGRIAGISGILAGLLRPIAGDIGWRVAFVAGVLAAPLVYSLLAPLPALHIDVSLPTIVAGGLLVGFGTRMGSGCTSGHGVCGLSRGSLRSLVATLVFMGAGFLTVFGVRHVVA
jgi:hypothetical protein